MKERVRMPTNIPEIIIFYIDLESTLIKPKKIIKTLENFVEEKKEKIPNSTFSTFFYKQGDVPFLSEETQDPKTLVQQLKDDWKVRETSKSFFENGLFYCLSFLAEKASKKAGNFRIIVLSDTPSNKSSEYAEALMGLVETVRNFPTFIDIIRIGESKLYPDDVKLRIISTITSGGLFYVEDFKEFKSTFVGLAKNKTLPDLHEGGQIIDDDKKQYYENIAKPLEPAKATKESQCVICEKKLCKYCEDEKDLMKCPACGEIYHSCCSGLYTWKYNIGLKHIFRCLNCQSLIRMDEDFVYEMNGEAPPSAKKILSKEELEESTKEQETWEPEKEEKPEEKDLVEKQKQQSEEEKTPQSSDNTTVKMGLFGPMRVAKKGTSPKSDTPKEKPEKTQDKTSPVKKETKQGGSTSLAARRREGRTRKSTGSSRICPMCSTPIKPGQKTCPNCGSPIH